MRKAKLNLYKELSPIVTYEEISFGRGKIQIPIFEPFIMPANKSATLTQRRNNGKRSELDKRI